VRLLLVTRGSSGHLMPLVPHALAAQRAGHEVLVAAQRGLAANVERTALPFAVFDGPAEEEWRAIIAEAVTATIETAHARMISDYFGRLDTVAALPELTRIAERFQPDEILRDSWEFASTLVAHRHDIPLGRVGLGLASGEAETVALVEPVLEELGLPHGALDATPYLTTMPEPLEDHSVPAPPTTQRFRHDAGEPAAHDEGPPLVYLTFGSITAGRHLPYWPGVFRGAIEALAPLPIRLLVTTGEPRDVAELGPLPRNVRVEQWVPQAEIAADVIVCHGGHGTTLGALAHGVPVAVLPLFALDQAAHGRAVAAAGAGLTLDADLPGRNVFAPPAAETIAGLGPAVQQLLGESAYRLAAERIAAAMRALPPVEERYRMRTRTARERPSAQG
jgi:UDP:flavonoid glycosyltransferase YjiC (YdhE family)